MCDYAIIRLQPDCDALESVASLWRANRDKLGFFPEIALKDYAARGGILAAVSASDKALGYVMYYVAKGSGTSVVHIIHLCVDMAARGGGIARTLMVELRKATRLCSGARVRCRRDFPANSLWPRLGFHAIGEVVGRAGLPVTDWWLDYCNPDLFSTIPDDSAGEVVAVLDACVFFGLLPTTTEDALESRALLGDWIPQTVRLRVTPELRNEINRNPNQEARRSGMASLRGFEEVRVGITEIEVIENQLEHFLPVRRRASDASDLRELAYAIGAGAQAFLTYDPRLLGLDDAVYAKYGLSILRPCEFITRLDEARREREYCPIRMMGSDLASRRPLSGELGRLARAFRQSEDGERERRLRAKLASLLSMPESDGVVVLFDGSAPVMLLGFRTDKNRILEVPLIRVARGRWEETLAEFAASHLIALALESNAEAISVQDEYPTPAVCRALASLGYVETSQTWERVVLRYIAQPDELAASLLVCANGREGLRKHMQGLCDALKTAAAAGDIEMLCEIERAIWPAKTAGTGIPAVVVPIRPDWAAELFDHGIGQERLFASDPSRMLRSENAYYSAAPASLVPVPSRVLWYVSQDKRVAKSKAIRAASVVSDVVSAAPKQAYRRFRRLGAYSWKDVSILSDRAGSVTALHFGLTEMLPHPIGWEVVQEVLRTMENRHSQFQGPTRIDPPTFDTLYAKGIGCHPA